MPTPTDEILERLRGLDTDEDGASDQSFALRWGGYSLLFLCVGGGTDGWMELVSIAFVLSGPFVVALRFSIRSAPLVARGCADASREELHLAGLSPYDCLNARLAGPSDRLLASVLIAGWPVALGCVLTAGGFCLHLLAGASDAARLGFMHWIGTEEAGSLVAEAIWVVAASASAAGAIWFAIQISASSLDEMILHARGSAPGRGTTLGELKARGAITVASYAAVACIGLWMIGSGIRLAVGGLFGPASFASGWRDLAGVVCLIAVGGAILWMIHISRASRRDLARVRMDAPE